MKRHFLAATLVGFAALPLFAAMTVEPDAVSATVTPSATTAWIGRWRTNDQSFGTSRAVLPDDDHNGVVRWQATPAIPDHSLWAVVDVAAGTVQGIRGDGRAVSPAPVPVRLLRDTQGAYSWIEFPFLTKTLMCMWVRPGVGTWWMPMFDNLYKDVDPRIGRAMSSVREMNPYPGSPAAPDGLREGDLLVGIQLEAEGGEIFFGGLVDERLAAATTEPARLAMITTGRGIEYARTSIAFLRTGSTEDTVTLRFTTADDTALAGVHYKPVSGTLRFDPGVVSQQVWIEMIDDLTYSGEVAYRFEVLDVSAGTRLETPSVTRCVIVNDDPVPVLTIGSAEEAEGGEGGHVVQVPVTLTGATRATATLDWRWVQSTASNPQPSGTGRLVFAPGETSKSIPVPYDGNTIPNANLHFTVSAVKVTNATATNGSLVIMDDDSLGITPMPITVPESAGSAMIPVALSAPHSSSIQAAWKIEYQSAGAADIGPAESGTVTFAPGETLKHVSVPIIQDDTVENQETFRLVLVNATAGTQVRSESAVITIDDDFTPEVFVSLVSPPIESMNFIFGVAVDRQKVTRRISLRARTVDGTARAGSDFDAHDEIFQVGGNLDYALIAVGTWNNGVPEPLETFALEIVDPLDPNVVHATEWVTIEDDDLPPPPVPSLRVEDVSVHEGVDDVAAFEITLSEPVPSLVTFRAETAPGTAASAIDFMPLSETISIPAGATRAVVNVPIVDDTDNEVVETFELVLSQSSGAAVARASGRARIVDDDGAANRPAVTAANIAVPEGRGPASFELRLPSPHTTRIAVEWWTEERTASGGDDFMEGQGTVVFEPGEVTKTIQVPLVNDTVVEDNETFVLALASADAAVGAEPVCTITNDDDAPKGRRRSARH